MRAGILKTLLSTAPVLLALLAAPSALAYKAGQGADDEPAGIVEYANVAAYLADSGRNEHRFVKIGTRTFSRPELETFHSSTGLTDANLIASYANVAAYLADTGRAGRFSAEINGKVYLVTALEAANNAGTLADASLPDPLEPRFATTAVGDNAEATAYDATAVGESARASGGQSTAVGQFARAFGGNSTAVGDHARAYSSDSVAVGQYSHASGHGATAVGRLADSYGAGATSLGRSAVALGERTTALGRGAIAANFDADQYDRDAVPERGGVGTLIKCAHDPSYGIQYFTTECNQYMTAGERADARLAQDNAAGETFRQGIRTRLQGRLTALSTSSATAVGTYARALNTRATAVGQYAQATGERSTALGQASDAAGDRSTALGNLAWATGRHASAVGQYAEAHGENTVALGRKAVAGGVSAGWIYTGVGEYLADSDRTTRGDNVVIGGKVYAVTALEAVSGLSRTNLPTPVAAMSGGVAVGADSRAAGQDSIAFGRGASATAANAIAIGAGVAASAENQIVIGGSNHAYRLPGIAAAPQSVSPENVNPDVITVDRNGQLSADGGTLHGLVGKADAGPSRNGNAYARLNSIQQILDRASDDTYEAIGQINVMATIDDATRFFDADTDGDGLVDTGGDGGRVQNIVREVDQGNEDRVTVAKIRTGSGADRTIVTLKGATNEQITALVALLTDTRLSTEPVMDANGDPVGTTMTEFLTLDEGKGQPLKASERLAYLFQALYGAPYGVTGVADAATDSESPHAASIAGRLDSIDGFIPRGTDGTLQTAPVTEAEETPGGVERKIVVQDVYQDGDTRRVRLRTLDFSQLAGADQRLNALDRRVGELDARLDKTTAMASALTALPNVVPHGGRFFLGVGAGQYGGESALAIGMSARVGEMNNVFVNAGVAASSGASAAGRAGVGFVW